MANWPATLSERGRWMACLRWQEAGLSRRTSTEVFGAPKIDQNSGPFVEWKGLASWRVVVKRSVWLARSEETL